MGEILGTLLIVLAVAAYAAQARALGRELRELVERRREELAREQIEDAELIARELELRYTLSELEDVGSIDLSGIEGLGG